jgi:hypothetical protein
MLMDFSGIDLNQIPEYRANMERQAAEKLAQEQADKDRMSAWGYNADSNSPVGIGNFGEAFTQRKALDYSNPDDLKRILAMAKTQQDYDWGAGGGGMSSGVTGGNNFAPTFNPYTGQIGMKDGMPIYTKSIDSMGGVGPSMDRLKEQYKSPYFYTIDKDGKLSLQTGLSTNNNDNLSSYVVPAFTSLVGGIIGGVAGPLGTALGSGLGAGTGTALTSEFKTGDWGDSLKKGLVSGVISGVTAGAGSALSGLDTFGNSMALAGGGTGVPVSAATSAISGAGATTAANSAATPAVDYALLPIEQWGPAQWDQALATLQTDTGQFFNMSPDSTTGSFDPTPAFENFAKQQGKKLLSSLFSPGQQARQPLTARAGSSGLLSSGYEAPQSLEQTIQNVAYQQATPSQVPLAGYTQFDRALTPYNLRKKKKLIEDELYPYIA